MVIDTRCIYLFRETGSRHYREYREIMKLFSLFGYMSVEEVLYFFKDRGMRYIEAQNRLFYLYKYNVLSRFVSYTVPRSFYCINGKGRELVKQLGLSEFVSEFCPSMYNLSSSFHHRALVKVYIVFKRVLNERLRMWITEERLKREEVGKKSKVFDAEVVIDAVVKVMTRSSDGSDYDTGSRKYKEKRCMIEVEYSLKSQGRYEKMAEAVSEHHWRKKKVGQEVWRYIYICNGEGIKDRIKKHLYNRVVTREAEVLFIDLESLINKEGEAEVEDIFGNKIRFNEIYTGKEYVEVEGML